MDLSLYTVLKGLGISPLPGESLSDLWGLLSQGVTESPLQDPLFSEEAKEFGNFANHYHQHIRPQVEQFEIRRKEHLHKLRNHMTYGLLALIFLVPMHILAHWLRIGIGGHDIVIFLALFIYGAVCVWMWQPIHEYKSIVKQDIYPHIFSFFGSDYYYSKYGNLAMEALRASEILPSYSDAQSEDYVRGSYRGVALETQELTLTEEQGFGKHRSTVTVFQGVAIRLSMNKRFQGHTVIKQDKGRFDGWPTNNFSAGKERVTLEDPRFEDEFEVYSSDQIEARYLLTPSFMERLQALTQICGGTNLQAAFYEKCLLLMIATPHDRFGVASIFTPATFEIEIRTILAETKQLFGMIEHLKLCEQTRL